MDEKERDRLSKQFIMLGDMLGNGDCEPWVNKEYIKIKKILYPDINKKRKPNKSIVRQLKSCSCGQKGWLLRINSLNGTVGFACAGCDKYTGECKNYTEAKEKWNNLFL